MLLLLHRHCQRGSLLGWGGCPPPLGHHPDPISGTEGSSKQPGWTAMYLVCARWQFSRPKLFLAPWMPNALPRAICFLLVRTGGIRLGELPKVVLPEKTLLPLVPVTQGLSVPRAGGHGWRVRKPFLCWNEWDGGAEVFALGLEVWAVWAGEKSLHHAWGN